MPVKKHSEKLTIAGCDPSLMQAYLERLGADPGYAVRLLYWVYRKRITSFGEINDIPLKVIDVVRQHMQTGINAPELSERSSDGTVKYLFKNSQGMTFEAVYLPEAKRVTACVSVQSGCRMGCRFCATGLNGWRGNLTAGEIVSQVLAMPAGVTHVVLMGMGEPCDNIDEVIRACTILTAGWGLSLGRTRVTVSTVGVLPGLKRLIDETECNITLSLHSPFPEERREVIPAEAAWPFTTILETVKGYTLRKHRRFTVAYLMIKGVNDTERHLAELKRLLSFYGVRVNLLPYHPVEADGHQGTDHETMMRFKHQLVTSGIEATVRRSRGTDIDAACGMLAGKK